ncbi:MAG: hypothetical protein QNJ54_35410 [Prochloraceae cyanobacterium]|nr:hypothetical protein [Prochloraceae cyanobacterium]
MQETKANHNLQRVDVEYILENSPNISQALSSGNTIKKKYCLKSEFLFLMILAITCSAALKFTFDGLCWHKPVTAFSVIHKNQNNAVRQGFINKIFWGN